MTVLTEKARYAGDFIMTEGQNHYSRDAIKIASGQGLVSAGTVLAETAAGTAVAAAKSGGNTGNGVFTIDATTPVLAGAKAGIYSVRCVTAAANGGVFRVEDPDGNVLGDVAVAATFADDIKFSIADGATDFVVGDGFDVTVNPGQKKYVKATNALLGRAINIYEVDATSADVDVAGIVRHAEVNGNNLAFDASVDDATKIARKKAELKDAGIIVR